MYFGGFQSTEQLLTVCTSYTSVLQRFGSSMVSMLPGSDHLALLAANQGFEVGRKISRMNGVTSVLAKEGHKV